MSEAQPVLIYSREVELPPPGAEIDDQKFEVVVNARRDTSDLEHAETATEGSDGLGVFRGLRTGIAVYVIFGILVWLMAWILH